MLRGLVLRVGKISWARADVWRLLFCKVTTKNVARKLRANCCSSGGGSVRLAPALTVVAKENGRVMETSKGKARILGGIVHIL